MTFRGLGARVRGWLSSRIPSARSQPSRALEIDPADPDRIGFGPDIRHRPLSPPSLVETPWARDVGWGGCVTFLNTAGGRRRAPPAAGETVPVRLSFPFQGRPGMPFWALFSGPGTPARTRDDLGGPGDLAALRLLHCRLVAPVRGENSRGEKPFALGEAEILEALRPEDLLDEPVSDGALGNVMRLMGDVVVQVQGPLRLARGTYYTELYDELVLWQDGERLHLLVAAHWSVNRDVFAFGNRPLTPDEIAMLSHRIGVPYPAGYVAPSRNGRFGDQSLPSLKRYPWAAGVGFESYQATLIDADGRPCADAPRAGETARLELRYPFAARLGAPFWALYESPGGYGNGYVDDPDDARHIAAMRFVRCRLLPCAALPEPSSYETLELEAEILEVLGPNDLLALPPSDGSIDNVQMIGRLETNSDGPRCIIDGDFEGDIGTWLLLMTVGSCVHLLAYGYSGFQEGEIAFGNRPLTETETARFAWALKE